HDPQLEQVAIELGKSMWVAGGHSDVADVWGRDGGHDASPLVGYIIGPGVQRRSTSCMGRSNLKRASLDPFSRLAAALSSCPYRDRVRVRPLRVAHLQVRPAVAGAD